MTEYNQPRQNAKVAAHYGDSKAPRELGEGWGEVDPDPYATIRTMWSLATDPDEWMQASKNRKSHLAWLPEREAFVVDALNTLQERETSLTTRVKEAERRIEELEAEFDVVIAERDLARAQLKKVEVERLNRFFDNLKDLAP